jgi:hypothetical protein
MKKIINKTSFMIVYPFGGKTNKIIRRYKPSTIFLTPKELIIKYWGLIKVLTIPLENIKKIRNIEDLEWKNKTTLFSGGAGGISFSFGPTSFSKIPVRNGIEIEYKNNQNEDRGLLIVSLDKERLKPLKLALENLK